MGILDDAEVSGNEIPKDPFGFGRDYWVVSLLEFKRPKLQEGANPQDAIDRPYADISASGKQYGGMAVFRVHDERFQFLGASNPNQMPGQLGFGQWWQLPSPKWARERVPFDLDTAEGKKLVFNWSTLCVAAGISLDRISSADIPDVIGKPMLAQVYANEDENGFWGFRLAKFKPLPKGGEGSPQGIGEFMTGTTSNPSEPLSEIEKALRAQKEEEDAKREVAGE